MNEDPHRAKRQTGRTTRMLDEAARLSKEGRAVYIIVPNENYQRQIRDKIREMLGNAPHGIKVEIPEAVPNFNWRTMKLDRAHPNCVVLVDHYAIEDRFGPLLQAWTRFDDDACTASNVK